MMRRVAAALAARFRAWERSAQIGLALALALLLLALGLVVFGPEPTRRPALFGAFGLLIVTQVIFMWANRHLVTPYTRAQRLYLMGDLEAAREVLEAFTAAGKADAQALTLLGNTYRQLGLLDESEQVLTKAVDLRPSDHFPRCGFGRTLLVKGLYEQAQAALKQAIQAGAPPVVRLDLAETYYRMGQMEAARALLLTLRGQLQEPYRALLLEYLLFRTGEGEPPPRTLIEAGLPFWAESAARFQHTPYGAALADDVYYLQTLSEE